MARNALSYGDTDSDNPLARAAAYAAPWTTDGADTSVGAPSIGAGADAVGQWMAAQLAKMQGTRPTAPIWNPDNPVGTETLQSMGMPQPTNYAGLAGQYVNPATGQLTTQGEARMADNPLLGFDTGGIGGVLKGFHGSPHAFDRFSNDAIGSGEGAQAYGYGHYLADAEDVARNYRDNLSRQVSINGAPVAASHPSDSPLAAAQHAVASHIANGVAPADAIALEESGWRDAAKPYEAAKDIPGALDQAREFHAVADQIAKLDPSSFIKNPGHMYEVAVNADPAHFLDWEKPLSEQSQHVQKAFGENGPLSEVGRYFAQNPRLATNGAAIEDTLKMMGHTPHTAAQALNDAGIPGIRYLDAGSRGAGEGSRNTVVFSPETMNIIRRYGLAGLMAGGGAAALGGQGQQQ